jgi:hypothetical protein
MRDYNNYITGPHNFWMHFAFGLVFGVLVSAWVSVQLFDSASYILGSASIGAVLIAYCCGRWGDSAWHWLIEHLSWIR